MQREQTQTKYQEIANPNKPVLVLINSPSGSESEIIQNVPISFSYSEKQFPINQISSDACNNCLKEKEISPSN